MLKHLYKTFLISVISGSLLSFNPSVAFAVDEGKAQTTTDNNGVITAKKNYKFAKITDSDMLASITMLAGGVLTGRMLKVYKPPTPDVLIAAAGGVAYMAGEVMTNVKFNGTIKEMTIEVEKKNNGEVNEEQIKRLEELKKSYEEAKTTTKYKKMLQLGAAAAFGAAAVYATYLTFAEDSTAPICRAAIATSMKALSACAASGATGAAAAEATACAKCIPSLTAYSGTFNSYVTTRATPKFSFLSDKAAQPLEDKLKIPACAGMPGAAVATASTNIQTNCVTGSVAVMIKNQTQGKSPAEAMKSDTDFLRKYLNLPVVTQVADPAMEKRINGYTSYFEKGLDLLFPKAQASWLPLIGYSASTIAAFTLITATTFPEIDLLMFVPRNRAIAWGVFTGLAFMSAKSSDNVMKKLDENIAKIDEILAGLNSMAKGVKAQNMTQQRIGTTTIGTNAMAPIAFSTDGTIKTDCMTGNNSTKCEALKNQLTSMPGFANLPDSFKDIASQSVSLGDQLSGATGISGSALASAESLGAKQNAIAKLLQSRQAVMDKMNPKTTMKKEQEKLEKSLAASVRKALEKKGMTATGFMASIGSTPIDTSLRSTTPDATKDLAKGKPLVGEGIDLQAGAGADNDAETLKLDFKEESAETGLSMGEVNSASKAAPDYDMKSTEINGENGPTLFELISGRYIKSGYPKLLEEEPSKN